MLNKINKAKFISILVILYIQVYLLNVLQKLTNFSFNGGNTNSRWSKEPSYHKICFNKKKMPFHIYCQTDFLPLH